MPLYRVISRPDLLTYDQRQAFSQDVVDVHCRVTGAPPSFVHVLFVDSGEQMAEGHDALIASTIRAGRNADQKREIAGSLRERLVALTGLTPDRIATTAVDVQASYTMEGGQLLPEPGSPEEAAWNTQASQSA